MDIKEDFERLPLRHAWVFLNSQASGQEAGEIRNSKDSNTVERARVLDLLRQKGIFDEFAKSYWPHANTEEGKKLIAKYERAFSRWSGESEDPAEVDEETAEETSFALETHLRDYLKGNLHRIEQGFKLYKDKDGKSGVEYPIDSDGRRVDILAIDKDGTPVVLELKVARGHEKVIGQCLYYRGKVKEMLKSAKARIVIVAREIAPELRVATEELADVQLFEYELSFAIKKV